MNNLERYVEKLIQKNWTSKRFNVNWAGRCFRFWTISIFLVLNSSNFNSWVIRGNSLSHKYCRNCTIIFINRKFISINSLFSKKGEYPVYVIHFINNSNSHFFYCHLYSTPRIRRKHVTFWIYNFWICKFSIIRKKII